MQYDQFIKRVQERGAIESRDEATRVMTATVQALGEHLAGGEKNQLFDQLPQEITFSLPPHAATTTEGFDVDEFYRRVSEHAELDLSQAQCYSHAVIATLQEAISPGEIEDMRAQLPEPFLTLFTTDGTQQTDGATGDLADDTRQDEERMDRAAQAGYEGAFGADAGAASTREQMRRDAEAAFNEANSTNAGDADGDANRSTTTGGAGDPGGVGGEMSYDSAGSRGGGGADDPLGGNIADDPAIPSDVVHKSGTGVEGGFPRKLDVSSESGGAAGGSSIGMTPPIGAQAERSGDTDDTDDGDDPA